jgi:tryptophanyl-tRNA synthetase
MSRRFTGLKPTSSLHLGNYLTAIRPVVAGQHDHETVVAVVDLHALTVEHDPDRVGALTRELATALLAAGLDPATATLYRQSRLDEHTTLHYLLECATGFGEAGRMIQFREKSAGRESVRLSLLTYPVLMAADILLHDTEEVPVGDDQRQHVELARELARRVNARYGPVFTVPRAVVPDGAARIRDLADPTAKMGRAGASRAGVLGLLDPPDVLARTVGRALTDGEAGVGYDPERRPGVANLLDVLAACAGGDPAALADRFTGHATLKHAVTEAVVDTFDPVRRRYAELAADPGHVDAVLRAGADRARERAAATVGRARDALGLAA